jgi:tetratricopeptide (TPR) repeat protein
VPLDWAMTQNNLGNVLATLGERESGTDRLEQAVAAYRAALTEYTRERVPLQWATTQNNLGGALMVLAERTDDERMARTALAQIELALATARDGGHDSNATHFAAQLRKAEALVERLSKR